MATRKRRRKQPSAFDAVADMMTFGQDCQEVIGRRLVRLARGDGTAFLEAQRMVAEKASVTAMAAFAAALAWPLGAEVALQRTVATYHDAVRANRRRLRRR